MSRPTEMGCTFCRSETPRVVVSAVLLLQSAYSDPANRSGVAGITLRYPCRDYGSLAVEYPDEPLMAMVVKCSRAGSIPLREEGGCCQHPAVPLRLLLSHPLHGSDDTLGQLASMLPLTGNGYPSRAACPLGPLTLRFLERPRHYPRTGRRAPQGSLDQGCIWGCHQIGNCSFQDLSGDPETVPERRFANRGFAGEAYPGWVDPR